MAQAQTEKMLWKRVARDTGRDVEPSLRAWLRDRRYVGAALDPEDEEGYAYLLEEVRAARRHLGPQGDSQNRPRGRRPAGRARDQRLGVLALDERRRWDTAALLRRRLGVRDAPAEPVVISVDYAHAAGLPMHPATISIRLPDFASDKTVLRAWRVGRGQALSAWRHYQATLMDAPLGPLVGLAPRVKLKFRTLSWFRFVERATARAGGDGPGWGALVQEWVRRRERKGLVVHPRDRDRRHARSDYRRAYRILTGHEPPARRPGRTTG
jgi:hypothetical protein